MLSVILTASNAAAQIRPILASLFASDPVPGGAEAVVVCHGSVGAAPDRARQMRPVAEAQGWGLTVIDEPRLSRAMVMNLGDEAARGDLRAYIIAGVRVSPPLMAQLALTLTGHGPLYATGRPIMSRGQHGFLRDYARFWMRLSFFVSEAPGFGFFAVNAAGRARWAVFPGILSDEMFVRLPFQPNERPECPATHEWPLVDGFISLVRPRRRHRQGRSEIAAVFPGIFNREGNPRIGRGGVLRLAVRMIPTSRRHAQ